MQGNFIVNARGLHIDVHQSRDVDGANVIVWKKQGQLNQQWKIEYINIDSINNGIIPDKPFKIISKMRGARAITRSKNNLIIRDNKKNDADQLFVFDSQTGSIQPKRDHNVSIEIADAGRNRYAQLNKERDIWFQHFQLRGEYIVNERSLVFDVAGGQDKNGQSVFVWKRHSGLNQKWRIDYV